MRTGNEKNEYGGFNVFSSDRGDNEYISSISNLYSLNLARNALELLLNFRQPKRICVPFYTCHSIHSVVIKCVQEVRYYHIDNSFVPIIDDAFIDNDTTILVNNYFGLFEGPVKRMIERYGSAIIIDGAQGFYSEFSGDIDQILSPRKFFGVPDGGYLRTNLPVEPLYNSIGTDKSADRVKYIFSSDESSKNSIYKDYLSYRDGIQNLPLAKMSHTTRSLVCAIDFEYCCEKRNRNFERIHEFLGNYNQLDIPVNRHISPMCYPFLHDHKSLKEVLISKDVYVGTYWPASSYAMQASEFENLLRRHLCCLPIDQGMNDVDVDNVAKIVKSIIN